MWRRGAANAANGKAPDSVRDQMMRHDPKWATFNSAYINEQVEFHLQNAYCEEPTEDALIAMLSHIDVMRDPRATSNMAPQEIWDQVEPDPEILELEEERKTLKAGKHQYRNGNENSERIEEIGKRIRTLKAQQAKEVRKKYREYYFENRPTCDIEQQEDSNDEDCGKDTDDVGSDLDDDFNEPDIDLDIPERAELAKLVCKQPEDLSENELLERRIQFGECMVALMSERETVRRDIIAQRGSVEMVVKDSPRSSMSASVDMGAIPAKPAVDDAALFGDPFPCRMDKFQCPGCIGDGRLSYEERTFRYTRTSSRNKHFDSQHLPSLTGLLARDLLTCAHPKCTRIVRKFRNMDEYKTHQLRVHHIELRPAGGRAARSRKSSPAADRRKREEPSHIVWRLESPESPESPATTPAEPCNSEGVFQVQDSAVEMMHAAHTMNMAPPAWQTMEAMVAWQQFQPLLQFSMAPWPAQAHGSLFGGDMMGWEEQALSTTPYPPPLPYNALPVLLTC